MVIKNKDLNLILESFLKATRHHSEEAPGMAFVMTPEGEVTHLSGQTDHARLSAAEVSRYFENGILGTRSSREVQGYWVAFRAYFKRVRNYRSGYFPRTSRPLYLFHSFSSRQCFANADCFCRPRFDPCGTEVSSRSRDFARLRYSFVGSLL